MEIIILMIPISILLAFFFLAIFIISSKNDQFEDLETPPQRMLIDDQIIKKGQKSDK